MVDMTETNDHLAAIRRALAQRNNDAMPETSVDQSIDLIITDQEVSEMVMRNFPLPGITRHIVRRTGNGFSSFAVTVAFQLLLLANENRLGLRIRNSGVNPVTLILSKDLNADGSPLLAGSPAINLPATTGDWDGKIGDTIWGGSVSVGGAISTVTVAEF